MATRMMNFTTPTHRHFSNAPSIHLLLKNPIQRTKQPLNSKHFLSLSLHHSQPSFNPFPNFQSLNFPIPRNFIHPIFFGLDDNSSTRWSFASRHQTLNQNGAVFSAGEEPPEVAVVLLGWLGAKQNHLRRYAELYNESGIHAVTFVASVMDVLSFDLGKKLEERIGGLSRELATWVESNEGGRGRPRFLVFHTFSNTGWLAYGAILDNWGGRQDLLEKIKGCVVDSGGDPNIDPKVWAAGFTTALLKKNSSATYASIDAGGTPLGSEIDGSNKETKKPILIETWLLFTFEKLFSYILNLPDINRRLTKIISALTNQPPYPQLYLYSTGDKVIPFKAVESFIEDQRKNKKQVFSFNFGSSPHVDHYRTFPDTYSSQLHNFLKESLAIVGKL